MKALNFIKINILIPLHKVVDSIRYFWKDQRKREDLEKRRELKHLKNFSRDIAKDEDWADWFDKEEKIIEDIKEE